MENLKKTVLILAFLTINGFLVFSISDAVKQASVYKSYEFEKANNYIAAINELNKIYDAGDYFINIRLGWLNYLTKQYSASIKFYEKAILLNPYAIEA